MPRDTKQLQTHDAYRHKTAAHPRCLERVDTHRILQSVCLYKTFIDTALRQTILATNVIIGDKRHNSTNVISDKRNEATNIITDKHHKATNVTTDKPYHATNVIYS